MPRILIIGGSDAGISAALRARARTKSGGRGDHRAGRRLSELQHLRPSLFHQRGDARLAHTCASHRVPGLEILSGHTATSVDPRAKTATLKVAATNAEKLLSYDRLVVATGATPIRPELPGATLRGVFLLHTMADSFAIQEHLTDHSPKTAVIVGAGYIGLEMADALTKRGIKVTLLSRTATVLPTVDPSFGQLVSECLQLHGVTVLASTSASRIESMAAGPNALSVVDSEGGRHAADLVLLAVGVRPASDLAHAAGAQRGVHGALVVTRQMRTNLPDVFAAGDCVETYHRLLDKSVYVSLGTIAHKQGRVAGENAVGGARSFAGALGTQSLKVFDLAIARTGLLDGEARDAGLDPLTIEADMFDHKAYIPGAKRMHVRLTAERGRGRLLGAQIVGDSRSEISKRVDVIAAALYQGACVQDLNDMDLSYTPPFSSPWDPLQMAAQAWMRAD